jgi:hypothetical protein
MNMNRFILPLLPLALSLQYSVGLADTTEADISAAKTAIQELAASLQTELKSAMQAGGPVAAIGVCHTQAIPITQKVSAEKGLQVGRVSLRNRNPANMPNQWQTAVLEDFERQKAAGKDAGSLAWSETVNVDGGKEFRFMKAIPTGPVCLACHGTALSPEVSGLLAELYPQDRATGYNQGDIRGAFVVTRQLTD